MKKLILIIGSIILQIGYAHLANAQSVCSQTLTEAIRKFEQGAIHDITSEYFKECLNNGFTKQEQAQSYRLLTIVYLFLDDRERAEDSFMKLLNVDKEYTPNKQLDPSELVNLAAGFRTRPVVGIQLKAGANYVTPSIIKSQTLGNDSRNAEQYRPDLAVRLAVAAELPLSNQFYLGAEVAMAQANFTYENRVLNFAEISLTEAQTWLELPIYLKFSTKIGRLIPFTYLGGSYSLMLNSFANGRRTNTDPELQLSPIEQARVEMKSLRNPDNLSLFGGLGLKRKAGINYWILDVRYTKGLQNIVNESSLYDLRNPSRNELLSTYWYQDPSFSINQFSVMIGYEFSIYQPKKLNKK